MKKILTTTIAALSWGVFLLSPGCLIGQLPDEEDNSEWVVNADISGSASGDLYVAGYISGCACDEHGFVRRVSGRSRTTVYEGGLSLNGVWSGGDSEIVAVGSNGDVAIYDSGEWEEIQLGYSRALAAVWGSSIYDVYAVGRNGLIMYYDGVYWTDMISPTTSNLNAVWGSGPDDVFAVGDNGTVIHYVNGAWREVTSGTTEDLNAVWGVDASNVFAVGGSELSQSYVVIRYNGTLWQTETTGGPYHLLGIHGSSTQRIVAVGAKRDSDGVEGFMLEYDGLSWKHRSPGINEFLWDVWVGDDGTYTVAGPDNTLQRVD